MKLFKIIIVQTGEELCVAARTHDHAAEVFVTFWFCRTGAAPGEFQVEIGAPAAGQSHTTVQEVAAGHIAGVIVRELDGSMIFEPAIG